MAIQFFSEANHFKFKNKRKTKNWLNKVIKSYLKKPGQISFIFCSDEQLLEINQTYLKHFYYTDVITFNYNDGDVVSGDIYISIDRISENAATFGDTFEKELNRIMVHGVLHLIGFNDKTAKERKHMTELENLHLNEFSN